MLSYHVERIWDFHWGRTFRENGFQRQIQQSGFHLLLREEDTKQQVTILGTSDNST